MKFEIKIIGISPYAEPDGQQFANITTIHDYHRICEQYGVPITIDFENRVITIDLTKKED